MPRKRTLSLSKKASTARSENISFRITPDQLERLERKIAGSELSSPGDLAHKLTLEWLDGPNKESLPQKVEVLGRTVTQLRYDLLNVARFLIAVQDGDNRSEERDAEIERHLKDALGMR